MQKYPRHRRQRPAGPRTASPRRPTFPAFQFLLFRPRHPSHRRPRRLNTFFAREQPHWCINCAAYTAVDKAESEKESAFRINGDAAGYLAAACRDNGTRLIHISTDYVFDGSSDTPLKGERSHRPHQYLWRLQTRGRTPGLNNTRRRHHHHPHLLGLLRIRQQLRQDHDPPDEGTTPINVVNDQIGSPTYAADLAAAILHIIAGTRNLHPRYLHYSNEGRISWYEFALAIRELIGSPDSQPHPHHQYPTPAKRPRYSLLDKTHIRDTYGIAIPEWQPASSPASRKLGIHPSP